ncbi:MAG: ATP-binding protein [Candidatus Margulisiibacteriota bacterium]
MTDVKAKIRFSPRILDHLGISAYNSVKKCLAEIVANSYDADATIVNIALPDVLDEDAFIEINDNGIGMLPKEIVEDYLLIGRNRRTDGQVTIKGRPVIGSKGIGKLAGFGIATRIEMISVKDNIQSHLRIDKKELEEIVSLGEKDIDIQTSKTKKTNGTILRLYGLHKDLSMPDSEAARRHLVKALPRKADFKIFVNDVECSAEDIPGTKVVFNEEIEGIGRVAGYYVVANARQKQPGLSVRVRDRNVQDPSFFGLDTRAHGFFTAEKIVGEINADFLDPTDKNAEDLDLIKTSRDGFLEDSAIVQKFTEWASGFIKKIVQGVDEQETKKRADGILDEPGIVAQLDKLPPHVRSTATKVARSVIGKLKTDSDSDAKDLVEWIIKYYESSVLKEIMRSIMSADINEAKKLSELIREWGLNQVNSVVGIIKTQIEIIQKLEELIVSEKALEIEVHELIEANLWLVREGLELWSSDKSLKTLLEGKIKEIYKDKAALRPDLICKSRNDGNEAVLLEFKRPTEVIIMEHVTQAMEYEGLIKKHRPNIHFETFVIGRQYDPSVLATKDKLEKASVHLWSFEEILQRARARFEKILEILGQ